MTFVTSFVFWNKNSVSVLWVVVLSLQSFLNVENYYLTTLPPLSFSQKRTGSRSHVLNLFPCVVVYLVHLTSCISYKLGVRSKGIFKFRLNILGSNRSQTMLLPSIPHLGKGMNLAIYKQLFFFFNIKKKQLGACLEINFISISRGLQS